MDVFFYCILLIEPLEAVVMQIALVVTPNETFFLEHGIHHPPRTKPWEAPEILETTEVFKNNGGVYNVYCNEEAVKTGKPNDYPYPDVVQFTNDFYTMCNMIADGPL